MTDLLVLAAHPVELEPLEALLRNRSGGPTVALRSVGVGLVAASVGAATAVASLEPRALLLVGSVGVYPGADHPAEGLVVATGSRLIATEALGGRSAFPPAMNLEVDFDAALREGLRDALPQARSECVATTLGVTTDDPLAASLAAAGEAFENLEALGVATAATARGIPAAALFGITNEVGSTGREQWARTHSRVAQEVATGVVRWLDAGAPGLP